MRDSVKNLLLIYINDICNASTISEYILFADDTNLFFPGNELASLVNVISSKMKNLSEWFFANRLSINVHKSNYIPPTSFILFYLYL